MHSLLCTLLVICLTASAEDASNITQAEIQKPPAISPTEAVKTGPEIPIAVPNAKELDGKSPVMLSSGNNTSATNISEVVPPQVSESKPELTSARKQNIPDLLGIGPDSVRNVLGAPCVKDSDCTLNYTTCQSNACLCKDGFRTSKLKLESCVAKPETINDPCEGNSECELVVSRSECNGGKCVCPPSFIFDQGACWETKGLGGVCSSVLQCANILGATCLQGVCACPAEQVPSPTSNKCLKRARGYESECVEDIQCTETMGDSAKCNSNKCVCKDDYHYNGTVCLPDLKLGSPCEMNENCAVSLLTEPADQRACVNNSCACATGFSVMKGEDQCVKGAADQIAISLTWMFCVLLAKYLF